MQLIPVEPSTPFQTFGTTLDGDHFVFEFRWNGRAGVWYMDIRDEDEDPIKLGVAVVLGVPLGRRCTDPRFPRGVLWAYDTSGAGRDPGIDDLGSRVLIYFLTAEEYLAGIPA